MTNYRFPYPEPPANGALLEVAPGVLWLRMPLPYRLDHINIYLIADGDGWCVLDAGIHHSGDISLRNSLRKLPAPGNKGGLYFVFVWRVESRN